MIITSNAHAIDPNSIDAYLALMRAGKVGRRHRLILAALKKHRAGTDKEVSAWIGANAQPRISELLAMGLLIKGENRLDPATGVHVRVVQLAPTPGWQREMF